MSLKRLWAPQGQAQVPSQLQQRQQHGLFELLCKRRIQKWAGSELGKQGRCRIYLESMAGFEIGPIPIGLQYMERFRFMQARPDELILQSCRAAELQSCRELQPQ